MRQFRYMVLALWKNAERLSKENYTDREGILVNVKEMREGLQDFYGSSDFICMKRLLQNRNDFEVDEQCKVLDNIMDILLLDDYEKAKNVVGKVQGIYENLDRIRKESELLSL